MFRSALIALTLIAPLASSFAVECVKREQGTGDFSLLKITEYSKIAYDRDTAIGSGTVIQVTEVRTGPDSFSDSLELKTTDGKPVACHQSTILKSGTFVGVSAQCKSFTIDCFFR